MPQIAFLHLRIYKQSEPSVKLINAIYTNGNLKKYPENSLNTSILFIKIQGQQYRDSLTIEHPLYQHIEVFDETGNIHRVLVDLDSADFFIRFAIPPHQKINELKFFEMSSNKNIRFLNSIQL
ncbi:MAG: hypothetical protein N2449_01125 [Bacteroidales bacterium]|nr:hypothetical protein [Bacteroidales bacterium]